MRNMRYVLLVLIFFILIASAIQLKEYADQEITLLCPNGGEILAWDSLYIIRWYHNPSGPPYFYDYWFYLSVDGGQSYPYQITGMINPDSSTLEWVVPHISSTTCRIVIEVDSSGTIVGMDESDEDFAISETGVEEEKGGLLRNDQIFSTIHQGTFSNLHNMDFKIFDIMGRQTYTIDPEPGIYFIGVDGVIKQKIIKIK